MRAILKTSCAALALSSVFAGVAFADYVYRTPTGSVYVDTMPTGRVYVDPMPTGSIYVHPVPTRRIILSPSEFRERQRNEYHSGGEGDYYQGIIPPAPVP